MKLLHNTNIPLFSQIANIIEEQILDGTFKENDQIMSTNELSSYFKINPNTVLKGVNLLVDERILYKKRGIGMFVSEEAQIIIMKKRNLEFKDEVLNAVVNEAKKLQIDEDTLIQMIKVMYKREDKND
ncbi:MAG: GntR family transcriptional regulator [Erysipelothrix sp.]|nr:GntR family transcriptional regulator [Erysipelothrix sp.]